MKKSGKLFGIICGILLGIGITLTILGFTFGERRINWGRPYSDKEGNISDTAQFDSIREIEVEAAIMDLQIKIDNTLKKTVRVEHDSMEFAKLIDTYKDGEALVIRMDKNVMTDDDTGTVYLYVPEMVFDEVEIELGAGRIQADGIEARNLSITMGTGEVFINSFDADEVIFECGTGTINAHGNVKSEIEADCGAGSVNLALVGTKDDYHYEINCGIGKITIGDESYSGMMEKEYHSKNARKEMNLDCGIGTVNVEFHD